MELIRLILITIFVCVTVTQINAAHPPPFLSSKPTSLLSDLQKLKYKFTTDVQIQSPSTDIVEIDIEDPCDLLIQRKTCKVSDPESCKMCPYTTCAHFEEITMIRGRPVEPNLEPGDGYCVAMKNLSKACNQFHGKWAMIKASSYIPGNLNSNAYIRFCVCTKPGFIGNVTLFGSCDYPFVCDGQIEDINQPYDKLKCKCPSEYKSERIGAGALGCKPPTVEERVNWVTVAKPQPFTDSFINVESYFSTRVRQDIKSLDELMDPCSKCPVTGRFTFGRSVTVGSGDNLTVMCRPANGDKAKSNYGIPMRRVTSEGKRMLRGTWGPDALLAVQWKELWVYDSVIQDIDPVDRLIKHPRKQECVYVFEHNEFNEPFYKKLGLKNDKQYAINVGADAYLGLTILPHSTFTPRLAIFCYQGNTIKQAVHHVHTCDIMSANLAAVSWESDIVPLEINVKEENLKSIFLTRIAQEHHYYIYPGETWRSVQKLRCAFEVAKALYLENGELQYLSYNRAFADDKVIRDNFPLAALRVKPMEDKELTRSQWKGHKSSVHDKRHFLVEFVVSESNNQKMLLANHYPDSGFKYE